MLMEYFINEAVLRSVNMCSFVLHLECLRYAFETCVEMFLSPPNIIISEFTKSSFACFSLRNSGL